MAHQPKKYTTPKAGTILHGAENTKIKNPGPLADQDARNEWEQAQVQDLVFRDNATQAEQWLNGPWANWLLNYTAGREFGPKGQGDPDAAPLAPPYAEVVEVKDAESGGVSFDRVPGTEKNGAPLLCDPPKYKRATAPQHYTTPAPAPAAPAGTPNPRRPNRSTGR